MNTLIGEVFYGAAHAAFNDVVALRHRCWQPVLSELSGLDDGHDDHSIHFLIWNNAHLIASGRLCLHNQLAEVVDPHLYRQMDTAAFPTPWGCMCRLVIDPPFRGQGLSELLDDFRMKIAGDLNCTTMLGVWNPKSGINRKAKLQSQGYVSCSDNRMIIDGEFGESMPLAKLIDAQTNADSDEIYSIDIARINDLFNHRLTEFVASHNLNTVA